MDKLLAKLVPPISVSGEEGRIAAVIEELARPYGDLSRDPLGNLVLHRPGNGKRILLSAHMDTVGIIVTCIEEGGFIRFGAVGGLKLVPLIGQRVQFQNGVIGTVCYENGTKPQELALDKLYIDTAGQPVRVGDTAAFCNSPVFAGGKVISSYLDNRLGCAVCLKALELLGECSNDLYFVFSVQEEVGCRGAKTAAYSIYPDFAIAVDICGIGDTPGDSAQNGLTLDGGPVVKLMDAKTICHHSVTALLEDTAKELSLPVQRYVTRSGGTDAGSIFSARGGVPTGVLSIPIRYTHCPNEVADMQVAQDCAALLAAAIRK